MITNNIGVYEHFTKIIFQLSLNMHLISSSDSDVPVSKRCDDKTFCTSEELHLVDKVHVRDGDNALIGVFLVVES